MAANDYWTTKHIDGWQVKREDATRASSVYARQAEAWEEAKRLARKEESEAFLQGEDGRIRERNTYGEDPPRFPG